MKKKELIGLVTAKLRADEKRKPIKIQKHKFTITDSEGSSAEFEIGTKNSNVLYNSKDVAAVLDALIDVVVDAIKCGEEVSIRGFGNLKLHKRAARRTKQPGTDEWVEVEERFVPKFFFGESLRLAARSYELIKNDKEIAPKLPDPIYDEDDF